MTLWCVKTKRGVFLQYTLSYWRRDAIRKYNTMWSKPNAYQRARRKGNALAVKVEITEVTT